MSWGLDKICLNEKFDLIMDGAGPHQSKEKNQRSLEQHVMTALIHQTINSRLIQQDRLHSEQTSQLRLPLSMQEFMS